MIWLVQDKDVKKVDLRNRIPAPSIFVCVNKLVEEDSLLCYLSFFHSTFVTKFLERCHTVRVVCVCTVMKNNKKYVNLYAKGQN